MTFKSANILNITVLMGGTSFERDVSLDSGQAVVTALREAGHLVTAVDLIKDELPEIDPTHIVFPVMHGSFGEDGKLQKLLEDANFSFVGCGSRCSESLMNKVLTAEIADAHGILMPKSIVVKSLDAAFPKGFSLPLVVKPATQGSSIGLSLVHALDEWAPALALALQTDDTAVVQQFVDGVEVAVGVLHGEALPVVEIIPSGEVFDFDAKYVYAAGKTVYNCPPKQLDLPQQRAVKVISQACFKLFGCRDMTRMDFIICGSLFFFIEGNTIPGFTANSLLPKSAAVAGISFLELCDRLVQSAFQRSN